MHRNSSERHVCALSALEAIVRVRGPNGEREITFDDFIVLATRLKRDTNLAPGESVVAVDLPVMPFAARSHYLKVARPRQLRLRAGQRRRGAGS